MSKKQIAIIGSGSLLPKTVQLHAENLGKLLIDNDFRILCGGLGGVMESVCKGAKTSEKYVEGMTVGILPTYKTESANSYVDIKIATGMNYARNQVIIASSDAVVALGGGAGTLSEIAFAWQLNKPIIALSPSGGWADKLAGKRLDEREREQVLEAEKIEDIIKKLCELL